MFKQVAVVVIALGTMFAPFGEAAATVYSRPRAATRAPVSRSPAARASAPRAVSSPRYAAPRTSPQPSVRRPMPVQRAVVRPRGYSIPVVVPGPGVPDETAAPPPEAAPRIEAAPSSVEPTAPMAVDPPAPREGGTAVTSFRWYYGSEPSPGWRTWSLDGANRWHERYPDGHEAKIFDRVSRRTVGGCEGAIASSDREPDVEVFIPDFGCGSMSVLFRSGAGQWGSLGPMRNVMR